VKTSVKSAKKGTHKKRGRTWGAKVRQVNGKDPRNIGSNLCGPFRVGFGNQRELANSKNPKDQEWHLVVPGGKRVESQKGGKGVDGV